MGLSPGGVLNNQNPVPTQAQPLLWRITKWFAPFVASLYPDYHLAQIAEGTAGYFTQNHHVTTTAEYLGWVTVAVGLTYVGNRVLNYFEGQARADQAERDAWEREQYWLGRELDQDAERHRRDVRRIRGVQ